MHLILSKLSWMVLLLHLSSSLLAQDSTSTKTLVVDLGGALRYNYNLSSWKPNQVKRGGDFGFEVFRVNVEAAYDKMSIHIDQRFYAQGFGGAFLKYGWMQYEITNKSHLKIGLIPAYFGVQQFNSHSWFFQLPFYLGFEDDHDMGVSWDYKGKKWQIDLGFYKNAEELGFSDNSAVSDSRYSYDFAGSNKEINQVNARINYSFGNTTSQTIGTSLQYGGIWNIDTREVGSQAALGIHYEMNHKRWNIKAQWLTYDNNPQNADGQSSDYIEMTAYGAPYQTASAATIYSVGIAYSIPVNWGPISQVQLYNDYSFMDKSINEWEDTQMNVLGALISMKPVYIYVDYASGLHQPWLGPQWTGALSTGDSDNSWESRFNVNLGLYF